MHGVEGWLGPRQSRKDRETAGGLFGGTEHSSGENWKKRLSYAHKLYILQESTRGCVQGLRQAALGFPFVATASFRIGTHAVSTPVRSSA